MKNKLSSAATAMLIGLLALWAVGCVSASVMISDDDDNVVPGTSDPVNTDPAPPIDTNPPPIDTNPKPPIATDSTPVVVSSDSGDDTETNPDDTGEPEDTGDTGSDPGTDTGDDGPCGWSHCAVLDSKEAKKEIFNNGCAVITNLEAYLHNSTVTVVAEKANARLTDYPLPAYWLYDSTCDEDAEGQLEFNDPDYATSPIPNASPNQPIVIKFLGLGAEEINVSYY
ncbi:MAG: hypothetical protein M0R76_09210 [Proteobacteria bacterium]|nr:hypothetical protein [Pseudomonadota bacterium]